MALKVIKERSTGMYLAPDFSDPNAIWSEVSFVKAERVKDENDAAWLSTVDDFDLSVLASVELVGDQFEVLDLSGCEP